MVSTLSMHMEMTLLGTLITTPLNLQLKLQFLRLVLRQQLYSHENYHTWLECSIFATLFHCFDRIETAEQKIINPSIFAIFLFLQSVDKKSIEDMELEFSYEKSFIPTIND